MDKAGKIKNIADSIRLKIKKLRIPRTYLFFASAVLCAVSYLISPLCYFISGIIILCLFVNRPYAFIAIALFTAVNIISSHFFIVVESENYKNYTYVKTPSAKLYLEKGLSLKTGELIRGDFRRDKSKSKFFFKPSYLSEGDIKISEIPVVSKIMEYRERMSRKMFFSSGGRVYTAQALIFADKGFIPEHLKDDYTISGLAHLLAMSGTHTAIIIAIFLTALFFLPLKFRMIFAIFGVIFITILGVFTITVVRAGIFATIFMVCYIFDLKADNKKFLLFMMGIFMIFSPLVITDISFLLSFGAVFGIIYMVKAGRGFVTAGIITGIAATLITAPLAMYVFGMTNHMSVISTLILSPIIYLHILFSLLYLLFPTICLPALIVIEGFSNSCVEFFSQLTYFGFILKTIPLWLLVACVIFTVAALASKYKWASLIVLLVIFYPSPKPPQIIFPALTGANKGFLSFIDGRSEIFYQGNPSGFKYAFIPAAAKYGIKTFDYGDIRIFSGENNYIKVKTKGKDFTNVCLNEKNNDCRFLYHTRSNSISKKALDNATIHIIYKNKLEDKSIYELSKTGSITVDKGEIKIENKNKPQ